MKRDKEQIKEIILTDYIDGELSPEQKQQIDALIAQDPELQEFLQAVKMSTQTPFENFGRDLPAKHVWENIKEEIAPVGVKATSQSPLQGIVEQLKHIFSLSFMRYGMAFALILIIVTIVGVNSRNNEQRMVFQAVEQVEYLTFITDEVFNDDITMDYGSAIEQYFL